MISSKAIIRLTSLVSIIAWATMVFTELSLVFSNKNGLDSGIGNEIPQVALSVFILSLFVFFKYRIEKAESVNFVDLLWKVFVTGLLTTIVSLIFRLFLTLLGNTKLSENVLFLEFIYLINLGLIASFLISTFIVWKRLILYQKSKFLLTVWQIFEYALLISLLSAVLPIPGIVEMERYYAAFLILLGVFLSANMKWVAYLNFKQKWKSILLILLAMFYLGYFAFTVFSLSEDLSKISPQFLNFGGNIFLVSLMSFIFIYSLFSLLVILFNLPTSSVFEQKLEEVVNFQRLSQSIQTEQSEERVYEILLESATSTVFADATWIEIFNSNGPSKFYTHKISESEIQNIKSHINSHKVSGILEPNSDRSRNLNKYLSTLRSSRFRSILAFPIYVKNEQVGTLALLKDVSDGFNKEMSKIIDTFTNQAGISIENFRLLSEALENERYKEELKIAKRVQSSLLPKVLDHGIDYDLIAFSEAADEVGGDYYDTFRINKNKIALIISDVSGKGTSAAFHMSQMKGIFHSFAQLDLPPKEFLVRANTALSRCLDKASFITTSYFVINSESQRVEFTRAGHCPTLYYDSEAKKASYFQNKGLGLGIIRNDEFANYIQTNCFDYKKNDIIVLYTDGITEAKNDKGEEFGYERLKEFIEQVSDMDILSIQEDLISALYEFTGSRAIDDDYTTLIIKFT
ncbi:SpoIIE family protein phosphatase [Fulvivirga maritima]|uniref:PP2C family protein-serine/threonine phosphatase n=1 Tax=Fulvivirga maritima TaxID=2904247 RepID=UPI001F1CBB56|nr:GAF domain-containing SpoIIE family protein phosphatase [Fulvivirga maritima]UII27929.1 SpoIIE family protein phosphatase [Fulvivirga maritima]